MLYQLQIPRVLVHHFEQLQIPRVLVYNVEQLQIPRVLVHNVECRFLWCDNVARSTVVQESNRDDCVGRFDYYDQRVERGKFLRGSLLPEVPATFEATRGTPPTKSRE